MNCCKSKSGFWQLMFTIFFPKICFSSNVNCLAPLMALLTLKTITLNILYVLEMVSASKALESFLELQNTKRFSCKVCNRKYKYNYLLSRHQRYECGKDPMFPCMLCPYRAKQKGTLKKHVLLKHSLIPNIII